MSLTVFVYISFFMIAYLFEFLLTNLTNKLHTHLNDQTTIRICETEENYQQHSITKGKTDQLSNYYMS